MSNGPLVYAKSTRHDVQVVEVSQQSRTWLMDGGDHLCRVHQWRIIIEEPVSFHNFTVRPLLAISPSNATHWTVEELSNPLQIKVGIKKSYQRSDFQYSSQIT
jgi:hypothetical protein